MSLLCPEIKLSTSFRHWLEKAGFYQPKDFGLHRQWRRQNSIYAVSRRPEHNIGCRDRKRRLRVLPHLDRMDICDGYYDRWANSIGASVPVPRTEEEFNTALKVLLSAAQSNVLATWPECRIKLWLSA